VRDDGPGLDADAALHAFERFWRGRTRSSDPAGSGSRSSPLTAPATAARRSRRDGALVLRLPLGG